MKRVVRAVFAAGVVAFSFNSVCQAVTQATEANTFRVTPYVQRPAKNAVTLMWLAQTNGNASVSWWVQGGAETNTIPTATEIPPTDRVANSRFTADGVLQYCLAPEFGYDQSCESGDNYPSYTREGKSAGWSMPYTVPYQYRVRLTGLKPGTTYGYRVTLAGGASYEKTFRTAPGGWKDIRFIYYSDSETEPADNPPSTGRTTDWTDPKTGQARTYYATQTEAYASNLAAVVSFKPDLIVMAGDLAQKGSRQCDWDEFWRHNAGALNDPAGSIPIVASPGNHDYWSYNDGGESGMKKYMSYFEYEPNGAAVGDDQQERFHRVDYGPATFLFMDANNGDDSDFTKDTNRYIARENSDYSPYAAPQGRGCRAPDFNPGSAQYAWLEEQLKDAQKKSAFIFVVSHQCPYSVGDHGRPNVLDGASGELLSGRPLRVLEPLFHKYGVTAWLAGHDEMMERSAVVGTETCVDGTERPHTLQIWDMGIAGDGLRGGKKIDNPMEQFRVCPDVPELYDANGYLVDGGKHYGHLEVSITEREDGAWVATFDPVYEFFTTNEKGEAVYGGTRHYADKVVIVKEPTILPPPEPNLGGYVKDGLVGFWDARWNQGTDADYDPTATTWVDLSGQGQTATAGTGTTAVKWGVDRAYMNPSNGVSTMGRMTFTASEGFRSALNSRAWTQQLCLKVRNYMNHDVTFFGSNSGQAFYLRSDYASNHMFQYCGGYYGGVASLMPRWLAGCTDTLLRDDTRIRRYIDSKFSTDGAAPEGVASVGTEFRLGNVQANADSCDYELYAVRVYSRDLAAIEIAHNDDIDARRYFGKAAAGNFVQSVSSTGVKYGSPVPSYADPIDVAVGTEYTFSVADSVQTYASDGVLAAKVTDNNRAVYLGGMVRELTDEGLVTIAELDNATTSHQVTLASDTDVIWNWKLQYAMQASVADPSMGSVQIADRAAAGSDELWFDASAGGTVTVKAIPAEGMKFDCWVGDLPGTLLNEPEIELTMDQGRTVKASFIEAHHEPVTLTWKNTSGAKWNDVASWKEGAVPQDGDTIIITPNGTHSVVLDVAMPHLAKLVVSNLHASQVVTIKPDNWFCKIWADEIVFGRGVKLTTDKAFADTAMSNRVWIVANDLTMHKTTEINLDNRGWVDKSSPWYGRTDRGGGGHGGRGGPGYTYGCNVSHLGGGNPKTSAIRYSCEIPGCALYGCTYDSLEAPELPGTSSDKSVDYTGRAGGGAVRIDVANHAQVEGKIYVRGYGSASGSVGGAAGGSVWISARTVDGAAYIDAGQTALPGTTGGGGGGGRVSVTYDPAAQAAAGYVPQFEFRLGGEVGRPIAYARDPNSNPYYPGEEGTLYLSDMSFYPRAVLRGGGRVYFGQCGSDTLSFPDGLVITNSSVGFPQFRRIDIAGDLKIGGCGALICSDTELTVSGDVKIDSAFGYKTAGAYNTQCCGLELLGLSKLSVGGDFGIDNFGVLYTVAAPTNETTGVFTSDLAVAGDFTMTTNAWFIPQSHPTNAHYGATRLVAKNIRIDQGAMIDGRGRGFQNISGISKSFGPGAAPANGRGASHAGWGGVGYGGGNNVDSGKPWTPTAAGAPYGNPKFPLTPGSAGGYVSSAHSGSYGGGQIYLEARRTVTVDGTVSVAGATKAGQNNERGAGSGGSICIKTARLAGSGALIADGGSNGATSYNHGWGWGGGGGGGGGYICVLAEESPVQESFAGTMSAIGGNAYTEGELLSPTNRYSVWDHRGFDGKVYTHVRKGLLLLVR